MKNLRSGSISSQESEGYKLVVASRQVLEESIEMAKYFLNEDPAEDPEPTDNENRSQVRINVTAPVKVLWPGAANPVEAHLEDIS